MNDKRAQIELAEEEVILLAQVLEEEEFDLRERLVRLGHRPGTVATDELRELREAIDQVDALRQRFDNLVDLAAEIRSGGKSC